MQVSKHRHASSGKAAVGSKPPGGATVPRSRSVAVVAAPPAKVVPEKVYKVLVLPELKDPAEISKPINEFKETISRMPNVITDTIPSFEIALHQKGRDLTVGPPRTRTFVTPVIQIMGGLTKAGSYGNYNIDNDPKIEYAPGDVSSSKYEVFVTKPSSITTAEDAVYADGYRKTKAFVQGWDSQYFKALTDPNVKNPVDPRGDHPVVVGLEAAKDAEDYDWETAVERLEHAAWDVRPTGAGSKGMVPNSSLKRRTTENVVNGVVTSVPSELLKFSCPVFKSLFGRNAEAVKSQTDEERMENWPPRFKGLQFYNHNINKFPQPRTLQNTAYHQLEVRDSVGRTPEQFNEMFDPKKGLDIRGLLTNPPRPIPASLGLECGTHVSTSRTWHVQIRLLDIAFAVPYEILWVMMNGVKVVRELCSVDEMKKVTSCLDYLDEKVEEKVDVADDDGGEKKESLADGPSETGELLDEPEVETEEDVDVDGSVTGGHGRRAHEYYSEEEEVTESQAHPEVVSRTPSPSPVRVKSKPYEKPFEVEMADREQWAKVASRRPSSMFKRDQRYVEDGESVVRKKAHFKRPT